MQTVNIQHSPHPHLVPQVRVEDEEGAERHGAGPGDGEPLLQEGGHVVEVDGDGGQDGDQREHGRRPPAVLLRVGRHPQVLQQRALLDPLQRAAVLLDQAQELPFVDKIVVICICRFYQVP